MKTIMNAMRNKGLETALNAMGYTYGEPWRELSRVGIDRCPTAMFYGFGSFTWGHTATVTNPRYGVVAITEKQWWTNPMTMDEHETTKTFSGTVAEAIAYLVQIEWKH